MADINSIPFRMGYRKRPLPKLEDMLVEADRIYAYDKEYGELVWREATNKAHPGRCVIGSYVGGDDGHGYKMCMLLGHKFKVHQIVWLINTREFPPMPLDHIDGNKRNNKIENLRLASDLMNMQNLSKVKHDLGGVQKSRRGPRFTSKITFNRAVHHLGSFDTPEEAREAYIQASRSFRGEFSPV